jgi:hypothetical protein
MIKNKHKWGNNISNRDKFMVNSPRMHFDITSQKLSSRIIIFESTKII